MTNNTAKPTVDLAELLSQRRTKWNARTYAQRYERYFAPLRNLPLKILEIGIGGYDDPREGGDSLRAWKQYFPNAQLYGIDIVDKKALEQDRIKTFQGSQDDPAFLERVIAEIGKPDIIIDDGSHRNQHVIATFKLLYPQLEDEGGIYIVEDTHFSYVPDIPNGKQLTGADTAPSWAEYGGSLDLYDRRTMIAFFKRLADCLSYQDFFHPGYQPNYFDLHTVGVHFYRNQIFVLKGDNTAPGNFFDKNTLRPEWIQMMGLQSADQLPAFEFPEIDDPTKATPWK
jgi:hypothetical protein